MESHRGQKQSEVRLILIGGRWAGKSSSGNTILRRERFECGRTRTAQCEVRHQVMEGRRLTVVDAPGWSGSLSLSEIPEGDKQRFKLNASKCPPGPNAFLLVVPIDSAFSTEQRRTVEEHMKLLGERVWRFTMVLFTCGDFLGEKTIEQHIESEGAGLRWLVDKCRNRYHVISNKEKSDWSQVVELLQKVDNMVKDNEGGFYKVDEQTLDIIEEKQREVAERAGTRRRRAEQQRHHMMTLLTEDRRQLSEVRLVLLGSRSVGKTSVGNTILGFKEQEDGRRTGQSAARRGFVGQTEVTVVDTPGWWKGFSVFDTPEVIKEEVMRSVFLCPPGPHALLLVIDADASFNAKHLDAVTSHMELLGEGVWRRTMVVFTRGDWLGARSIEEYVEGEGEALQALVERCGNRYHVFNNKNAHDDTQVTGLLEKVTGTVAANGWEVMTPDQRVIRNIEERRRRVEEGAKLRESQVKERRRSMKGARLRDLTLVLLGQKTCGKSATGNTVLRREVFATCRTERCEVEEAEVAGRRVRVIDAPGWWQDPSLCTDQLDGEIVRGVSLSPSGVHAVLLVVPLDLTFREAQQVALEDHMDLLDVSVWNHTMVVFTYRDKLADESVEEHIEREHSALRWLVDRCGNRYHAMNNVKKAELSQVTELLEKVEEMVAGNDGRLFVPNMEDMRVRVEEKFRRRQLKHVLKMKLEREYRRRELELMMGFRETLLDLQANVRGGATGSRSRSLIGEIPKLKTRGIGQKKKDEKEEKLEAKIVQEIERLDKDIMRVTELLWSSKDFLLPDLKGDSPSPSIGSSETGRRQSSSNFDRVLGWLSKLQIGTNMNNQLTLNFSTTSGYRSEAEGDV